VQSWALLCIRRSLLRSETTVTPIAMYQHIKSTPILLHPKLNLETERQWTRRFETDMNSRAIYQHIKSTLILLHPRRETLQPKPHDRTSNLSIYYYTLILLHPKRETLQPTPHDRRSNLFIYYYTQILLHPKRETLQASEIANALLFTTYTPRQNKQLIHISPHPYITTP